VVLTDGLPTRRPAIGQSRREGRDSGPGCHYAIDGKDVKDLHDLARRIGAMTAGNSVRLSILRNGETRTVTSTLGRFDQRQAKAGTYEQGAGDGGAPRLGLTLAPASDGAGDQGVVYASADVVRWAEQLSSSYGDALSGRLGRHVIGRYGVGTLWCVRAPDAFFIQFNAKRIARRSLKGGAWVVLEDGWTVTPYEGGQIRVQLHNSEGVVVSLNLDAGK
jgi:hypothetical protein